MKFYQDTSLTEENPVFRQLVKDMDEGIEVQSWWAETDDYYKLKVFRLVKPGKAIGPPLMLQHGLFQSSEKWVWEGTSSLGIQFLNQGYDVWLGNNRGNIYSRYNTRYSATDYKQFYDYSFFEMGKYDLPAMISGILSQTPKYSKLSYIGFSQGTTQMFTALAYDFGNVREKLNLYIALAPIVNMDHATNKFYVALKNTCDTIRDAVMDVMGMYVIAGPGWDGFQAKFCNALGHFSQNICYGPGSLAPGAGRIRWPASVIPMSDQQDTNGASTKSLIHLGQLGKSGKFQQYSYFGFWNNWHHYHHTSPPVIPIQSIQGPPIHLYVGLSDTNADLTDARWLQTQVHTIQSLNTVPGFDHDDMILKMNLDQSGQGKGLLGDLHQEGIFTSVLATYGRESLEMDPVDSFEWTPEMTFGSIIVAILSVILLKFLFSKCRKTRIVNKTIGLDLSQKSTPKNSNLNDIDEDLRESLATDATQPCPSDKIDVEF